MNIDLLYLDLETCERCRGADRNLGLALDAVAAELADRGIETDLRKIHITSAEQARRHRLLSSPTLRVNGRDVALELRESSCGSEVCTDGCGESINCRVWVHGGEEHTVPPVTMIAEAIMRDAAAGAGAGNQNDGAYVLPENLSRFFADRAAALAGRGEGETAPCCVPAAQETCCEPGEKESCCESAPSGSCGCR